MKLSAVGASIGHHGLRHRRRRSHLPPLATTATDYRRLLSTPTPTAPVLPLLPLLLPLLLRPLRLPCPLPTRFDELHRAHRWVGARANDATFRLRMLPLTHPLLCSALGWLRLDQERLTNLHTGIPSLPVCSLAHSLPHLDTCVRVYPLA